MMVAFTGMETSGMLRRRFQAAGCVSISADILPQEDRDGFRTGTHIQGDVFEVLDSLFHRGLWPNVAVFHPSCTHHTNSAAWALQDPDFTRYPGIGYHQRVKPGTLVGEARRAAKAKDEEDVRRIAKIPIAVKVIENPIGSLTSILGQPSQIVQPYEFGDDASKATCLWFIGKDGEPLDIRLRKNPLFQVPGRMVCQSCSRTLEYNCYREHKGKALCNFCSGAVKERWANQTDAGQNRLSPGDDRWKERSRTYPGIADALVDMLTSLPAELPSVYQHQLRYA